MQRHTLFIALPLVVFALLILALFGLSAWVAGLSLSASQPAIWLAGVGVVVLSAGLWWILQRLCLHPAHQLSRGIRALLESRLADREIPLPRHHALQTLPDQVQALADTLRGARREMRVAMESAAAQSAEQKRWLEIILQGLTEGVLVCNKNHQILLYNASAVSLLENPERVGLGRSLLEVLSPAPVRHTMERLEWRQRTGDENANELSAPFVCTNLASHKIMHGRMALIRDDHEEITGYLITLIDISNDVATLMRLDGVRRAIIRDLRSATANLRAAAEVLADSPTLSAQERQPFEAVLTSEAQVLSHTLDELAGEFRGHALGRWPMADIYSADLINCLARHLEGPYGMTVSHVGHPLWLQGDSLSLLLVMSRLLQQVQQRQGVSHFEIEALLGDRRVYLDIRWQGQPIPVATLDQWIEQLCGEELDSETIRDVLERHGSEIWSQDGAAKDLALLRIPLLSPLRHQFAVTEEQLPARPEFYDFGLMREHEGDAGLAQRLLSDLAYVVFDTETTGLDPVGGDEIISIGGVRVVKGRVLSGETFERLIHPGRPIPPGSIRFHGITDEMVHDQRPIREVLPRFQNFVGEDAILVAHNAAYDMKFLRLKEESCGVVFRNPVIDTLLLSVMLEPDEEDHSLDALCERYGIRVSGRHTALGDALATAGVLIHLIDRLQAKGISTFGDVMRESNMAAKLRLRDSMLNQQGSGYT